MVNFLLNNVGPVAIQAAAEAVRRLPVSTPESAPDPDHKPDGCPMCQVHADLAECERLIAAMELSADPAGRIPPHMAATMVLVSDPSGRLDRASERLAGIAEERPDLADRSQALRAHLARTRAELPDRHAVNLVSARTAHRAVEDCWRESVALANIYFAPRYPGLDDVRAVLLELPAADRESFIASLRRP